MIHDWNHLWNISCLPPGVPGSVLEPAWFDACWEPFRFLWEERAVTGGPRTADGRKSSSMYKIKLNQDKWIKIGNDSGWHLVVWYGLVLMTNLIRKIFLSLPGDAWFAANLKTAICVTDLRPSRRLTRPRVESRVISPESYGMMNHGCAAHPSCMRTFGVAPGNLARPQKDKTCSAALLWNPKMPWNGSGTKKRRPAHFTTETKQRCHWLDWQLRFTVLGSFYAPRRRCGSCAAAMLLSLSSTVVVCHALQADLTAASGARRCQGCDWSQFLIAYNHLYATLCYNHMLHGM